MPKKKSDSEKKPKGKKATKTAGSRSADTPKVIPAGLPVMVSTAPKEAPAVEPAPKSKSTKATKPKAKAKAAPQKKAVRRPAISNEDIALRAYYIAERRHKMGWPGDEANDWIEAERQLLAEVTKGR